MTGSAPRESAWAAELAAAVEIAARAGSLLAERLDDAGAVEHKGVRDIVTEVDHASEALIRTALAARFPDDGFYGEESGRDPVAAYRTWVCDPLDGTVNYANGIPFFCVSLALVVDGRPVAGVVRDPLRRETFAATADGPATVDGRPVVISGKERLVDLVMGLAVGGRASALRTRRVRRAIRIPRQMGSAALALAYVANGRFDAYSQTVGLSSWDVAAAGLIAERAGATVTNMAGGPWFDLAAPERGMGLLAAPPAHHARLLDLLREPPRTRGWG
ncbi:MAG TPA: inositol monophosphatase [Patescibacteria group bacterium]|nr:inositol monophosphatase [Patescibacteria group bacterium]